MSRCVSLRVFSSQNSYTTSQSETPSATQAIERQRWRVQVFHRFKRTEPSNKLLSLSLSQHSEVEHSYFSKEVVSLNSLYPFLTFYPPIFLSLAISLSLSPALSSCCLLFLCGRVCDCQDCLVAVSSEVVSFNGKAERLRFFWSLCLSPLSSLCPFASFLSSINKLLQCIVVSVGWIIIIKVCWWGDGEGAKLAKGYRVQV